MLPSDSGDLPAAYTCVSVVCSCLRVDVRTLTADVTCAICCKEGKLTFQAEATPLFWGSAAFSAIVPAHQPTADVVGGWGWGLVGWGVYRVLFWQTLWVLHRCLKGCQEQAPFEGLEGNATRGCTRFPSEARVSVG